jgi:hypothetical protein
MPETVAFFGVLKNGDDREADANVSRFRCPTPYGQLSAVTLNPEP